MAYVDGDAKEVKGNKKKRKKKEKKSQSFQKVVDAIREVKFTFEDAKIMLPTIKDLSVDVKTGLAIWLSLCVLGRNDLTVPERKSMFYECDRPGNDIEWLKQYYMKLAPDKIIDPMATDLNIATMFVNRFSHSLKFVDSKGSSYEWNTSRKLWLLNYPEQTMTYMSKRLFEYVQSQEVVWTNLEAEEGMIAAVQSEKRTKPAMHYAACLNRDYEFDQVLNGEMWQISTRGGKCIDLRTLEEWERTRDDVFSIETLGSFMREEKGVGHAARIKAFRDYVALESSYDVKTLEYQLELIYPNAHKYMCNVLHDIDKRTYLRRRLALGLTTTLRDRSLYWAHGKGMGGKSQLLLLTILALGGFGGVANKNVLFQSGRSYSGSHKTHLIALKHKRLAVIPEVGKNDRPDEAQAKSLVSGDRQSAREIYKKEENFTLYAKMFCLSQHECQMDPNDTGFVDRTKAIIMDTRFWNEDFELKPLDWKSPDYKDGWDEEQKLYWRRLTNDMRKFADQMMEFEENGGHLNEFFSYLVLSACECYYLMKNSETGRLPVPSNIIQETKDFFSVNDLLKDFIDDHCQQVDRYQDGDIISKIINHFNKFLKGRSQMAWGKKAIVGSLSAKGLYNQHWRTSNGVCTRLVVVSDEHGVIPVYGQ
jgi:hypothetical protein